MWEMGDLYIPPKRIDMFLHRSIKHILGINMAEVKEQHIANETESKKFFDMLNIEK